MEINHDSDSITPDDQPVLTIGGTGALMVPIGTTAERPSNAPGMVRYNSELSQFEFNGGSGFAAIVGGGGGLTLVKQNINIDFGSAPGTNLISVVVTGQTSFLSAMKVDFSINPTNNGSHTEIEHIIANFSTAVTNKINNTGFTLNVFSEQRLTGTFSFTWSYIY